MPVEAIINKIIDEAEAEAERIGKQAEAEIEKIKRDEQEKIAEIRRSAEKDGEVQAREEKRKLISAAELEQRKELLKEKQELIEEVFKRATRRVVEMERDEYRGLIRGLLLKATEKGDEQVILCPRDKDRITTDLLEEVNLQLRANGKKGELRLSEETRDMLGGFILRGGRKEINCSLESVLASAREELESEVAQILF